MRSLSPQSRGAVASVVAIGLSIAAAYWPTVCILAGEPGRTAAGFHALFERRQRETLQAVADYVTNNPQADDLEPALRWMFETASAGGLEAEVVPFAEQFLSRRDLDASSRQLGQAVLCLGFARNGKFDEAMAVFESYLQAARFQSPFTTLDAAGGLAAQARLAGRLEVSRSVFERVAAAYPLNGQISGIVSGRIARQELIGQAAPAVTASDTLGNPWNLADFAGRVVLVDFWATNCAPCVAEFPNLRQIYKEHHERGLEIIGISFDDGPHAVEAFRERAKLPWRMVMNDSPQGVISDRLRTRTIPALFLIGRDGKIAQVDVRGRDLRIAVERLLADERK